MADDQQQYDVFISYAREDLEWVTAQLYKPLLQCRTADGRRPRIFFDLSEEGIRIGQNFPVALMQAIENSHRFVPVYSTHYFAKEWCVWELQKAWQTDPTGRTGRVSPILLDPAAAPLVLKEVNHINYWAVASPDWLNRLCVALELTPTPEHLMLKFLDQPPESIVVNYTLPPIRVAAFADNEPTERAEAITLRTELGRLQGKVSQAAAEGVVTFTDLSLGEPATGVRLIAEAEGYEYALSRTFAVTVPARTVATPPTGVDPVIPPEGDPARVEALFFGDGRRVGVLVDGGAAAIFDAQGRLVSEGYATLSLSGPIRLVRRSAQVVVLADWKGRLAALWSDGRLSQWDVGSSAPGYTVPGDIAIAGDLIFVGLWTGAVYKLAHAQPPVQIIQNAQGVQVLAELGGRLFVCGFDGVLDVYRNGVRTSSAPLDPQSRSVALLQELNGRLVAVSEHKLLQIEPQTLRVEEDAFQLGEIQAALGDIQRPVVIDVNGNGLCFDCDLTARSYFHIAPGAIPESADNRGRWCVFRNIDGSRTLMLDSRIVFGNRTGPLAVSPPGDLFAVGDEQGMHLLTEGRLRALTQVI